MSLSCEQNAGQYHKIRTGNKFFGSVESFKRFETNYQSEISFKKNINFKIYRTMILSVVLCGRDTWSVILREERGLRVFGNSVLRRKFGHKGKR